MKILKQLIFTAAVIIGISMNASAQEKGDKKPPPKPSPPVIVVNPVKNPDKNDKPKDDKRKKPDAFMFRFRDE